MYLQKDKRELLIFASFLLLSLWPHRGIVGCRWHFYEQGIRGCFPVSWEPLNVGCLGCCSLLILAVSGCVLETLRHADRWLFSMLSGISSDNCRSSQVLATELILSTLHNTKVKGHTGNYNYAASFWDVIHCPLQQILYRVPSLGNLSDKVQDLQDSSLTCLWEVCSHSFGRFHFASASASLSSPYPGSHSIYVIIFLLISSYTSHQMTLSLAVFVWACEMELSFLLSERCREMAPSPFSLFTPRSRGWSRSASGEWQLVNLWKLNRSQRRHLMISLATHAEVRDITLRWLQRSLCSSLAGLLNDRFHRRCGSHWCYKLLLCHRSRACFCFS